MRLDLILGALFIASLATMLLPGWFWVGAIGAVGVAAIFVALFLLGKVMNLER
jgi:hypothetical protein